MRNASPVIVLTIFISLAVILSSCGKKGFSSGRGTGPSAVCKTQSCVLLKWGYDYSKAQPSGFKAYYRPTAGTYQPGQEAGLREEFVLQGLSAGADYCFAVSAYLGVSGQPSFREGPRSSEICLTLPKNRKAPGNGPHPELLTVFL